eukprot:30437-Prymnesium_polylepis.2
MVHCTVWRQQTLAGSKTGTQLAVRSFSKREQHVHLRNVALRVEECAAHCPCVGQANAGQEQRKPGVPHNYLCCGRASARETRACDSQNHTWMSTLTVLTVPAPHVFDVLEKVEQKGLSLCALKSVGGNSQIVLEGGAAAAKFAALLATVLPPGVGLAVSSSEGGLLGASFSRSEVFSSDGVPGTAAPASSKPSEIAREVAPTALAAAAPIATATAAGACVEDPATNGKVLALLASRGISYGASTHAPVRTSEEAADIRGATLASGAKAMLLSVKPSNEFVLAVISASAKMDSKLMKKAVRRARLCACACAGGAVWGARRAGVRDVRGCATCGGARRAWRRATATRASGRRRDRSHQPRCVPAGWFQVFALRVGGRGAADHRLRARRGAAVWLGVGPQDVHGRVPQGTGRFDQLQRGAQDTFGPHECRRLHRGRGADRVQILVEAGLDEGVSRGRVRYPGGPSRYEVGSSSSET